MRIPVTLLLAALSCAACASADLNIVRPVAHAPATVSLAVQPQYPSGIKDEQLSHLRTVLTTALYDAGIPVVATGDSSASAVEGVVSVYDPGNRALRAFVGLEAGRGHFDSTWLVKDPAGANTAECRIKGTIAAGMFGGSWDDVLEKVGQRLGECVTGRVK